MGKTNKKFVPPMKSPNTAGSIDNGPSLISRKSNTTSRKKTLLVNFDYAKIKAQCSSRKQKSINKQQQSGDGRSEDTRNHSNLNNGEPDGSGDCPTGRGEFMWFEPMQANENQSARKHIPHRKNEDASTKCLTQRSPPYPHQNLQQTTEGDVDVYQFTSSPTDVIKEDGMPYEAVEEKKETKKKKQKMKKTPNGHVKKSIKKKVLKSLLKMQGDMAKLREKEQELRGSLCM